MSTAPAPAAPQHPITAESLSVQPLPDGTWGLTVTAPDTYPIVLVGTYTQMDQALADAFYSVHPNAADRELMKQALWDTLVEAIRSNTSPDTLADMEMTIDEYLDQIDSFYIDSDEWEDGWYPGRADARTADGTNLEVDAYFEEPLAMRDAVGEHYDALTLLGGRPGPRWDYVITRPSTRPRSTSNGT